jgi:hypothetical protein
MQLKLFQVFTEASSPTRRVYGYHDMIYMAAESQKPIEYFMRDAKKRVIEIKEVAECTILIKDPKSGQPEKKAKPGPKPKTKRKNKA